MSNKKEKEPKKYSPAIKRITSFIENIFEPLFTISLPFLVLFSILAAGTIFGIFLAATTISLYLTFTVYSEFWKEDLKDMTSKAEEIEKKDSDTIIEKTKELNNEMTAIQEKKDKIQERIKEIKEQNKEIQEQISELKNPVISSTPHKSSEHKATEEELVL